MANEDLRAAALAARSALSPEEQRVKSAAVCERILSLPEFALPGIWLSYLAAGGEADLTDVHKALTASGRRLAFPVSLAGGQMEAYLPGRLIPGRFGIPEPDVSCSEFVPPEAICAVLVPCVAFDEVKNRLGHGCGYYDRFLPRCTQAVYIGVAFDAQRCISLCPQKHDVPLHRIVTESTLY